MSPASKSALLFALLSLSSVGLVMSANVHVGCYANYDNGTRALPFLAMSGRTMSPALCNQMAKTRFATAYALEYGKECWLDPEHGTVANLTRLGASTACSTNCAGDWSSSCGGDYAMDLYTTDITTWDRTSAESAFTEVGCYRDSQESRAMHKLLWISNSSMSAELCAHIAYAKNWPIFGLQYGVECWGSDDLIKAEQLGTVDAATECTLPCTGNATQTCGGAWTMQIYQFVNPPATDQTHAGTTPITPANSTATTGVSNSSDVSLLLSSSSSSTTASTPAAKQYSGASRTAMSTALMILSVVAAFAWI